VVYLKSREELKRQGKMDKKIAYFAGCTASYTEPEVGKATILVLEKNGFVPVFPKQDCCAIPQLFYGNLRSFFRHAQANVRSLVEADCDIVTACTSCALAIKRDYPKLLKSQEAEAVAARTCDIMEYLVRLRANNALNTDFRPMKLNILYHAPCHLRVLGVELIESRLKLMRLMPGISVTWVDRGCCGMAGTFGVKGSNYAMSMTIGQALFEEIKRLAPDLVITECPGCKMQISQGAGITVSHPILIVKEAYGL
jgi:glycerol-3-phosphate dehydrogenase subunit C